MLIASLTTYSTRINTVHRVIESILSQTYKVYKILLWLDSGEFNPQTIPDKLKSLADNGVIEIGYYHNIRSYKKLIPTLLKYPDDTIIVLDDDIVYNRLLFENLVRTSHHFPGAIVANRARLIRTWFGFRAAYKQWPIARKLTHDNKRLFPTTGGGTLYPPHCFTNEVFNEKKFMSIAPCGDDIWFYAMARVAGTPIVTCPSFIEEVVMEDTQRMSLFLINRGGYYDRQIKAVFDTYNI